MKRHDIVGGAVLCIGVLAGAATANECEQQLLASADTPGDRFGRAIAVSGDTLIAGAHEDDDLGADSGSAYFFRYGADGDWTETDQVTASDGAAGDWFGTAVAICNDTAIVGASGDDDNGIDAGSSYIFCKIDGAWTQTAKLTASDGAAGDDFGCSVAVSGDTVVVGARGDDDNGIDSGSAYVFREYEDGNWVEIAKLIASDAAPGDGFGHAVGISGGVAIVGAPENDISPGCGKVPCEYGSAYGFRDDGTTAWDEKFKVGPFVSPPPTPTWGLGRCVAIDGTTAVVGGSAAVMLHEDEAREWSVVRVWASGPSDPAGVAINGDRMAIVRRTTMPDGGGMGGSPFGPGPEGCGPGTCPNPGGISVYEANGEGTWALVASVTPSGPFGLSVALSPEAVLTGGVGQEPDEGVVFAFELTCETPCYPDLNADGLVNAPDLLRLLDAWTLCPCDGYDEDLDVDGDVDVDDLVALIIAWGPC